MRRREHNHLERFVCLLEALHEVGSEIDAGAHSLLPGEIYLQYHIWILCFDVIYAMNQCFVHVKYEDFSVFTVPGIGQVD